MWRHRREDEDACGGIKGRESSRSIIGRERRHQGGRRGMWRHRGGRDGMQRQRRVCEEERSKAAFIERPEYVCLPATPLLQPLPLPLLLLAYYSTS